MSFQVFAETYLIPAQLACAMFGMGATLSVKDFAKVVKDPWGLALGIGLQAVAVPLLAAAFAWALGLSEGWAVGLILVSVVPGGAFSNLLTFLGKGNAALSIALTITATAGCIVTIPLVLGILAPSHLPPGFSLPASKIVMDIFLWLLLPLGMGMVVFRVSPKAARPSAKWAVRLALLLLATIVISSVGSGRIKIAEYGWGPPLWIIAFAVIVAFGLPLICRAARRYDDDTVAVSIEVTVRNIGVALLIFENFFPGEAAQGHVLYSCLFYSGISGPLALIPMFLHRKGRSPIPFLGARVRPPPGSAPNEVAAQRD